LRKTATDGTAFGLKYRKKRKKRDKLSMKYKRKKREKVVRK
jgi:hypothetical protein